jgi:hypothetical protein
VSKAADRVWSQVSGLGPRKAANRLLMVWQAYLDESFDDGLFVLSGYLATAESWAAFSREWEEMLPLGVRGPDGAFRFKMQEMAQNQERMSRVPGFYRIIEKHVSIGLVFAMRVKDFVNGKKRLVVLNDRGKPIRIHGELFENIYMFTFNRLMHLFHQNRHLEDFQRLIPFEEKVDFIFDDRSEKKIIIGTWEEWLENNPFRDSYGTTPRFERDDDFLPLQAADFFAWWNRKWEKEGRTDFAKPFPWRAMRPLPIIRAIMTEDNVFEDYKTIVLNTREPRRVYDGNDLVGASLGSDGEPFKFTISGDGIEFASDDAT